MERFRELERYTEKIQTQIAASAGALCIMQDNRVVHEWYSGRHHFHRGARPVDEASQFNVYSTRVTYVGLAAAIALQDGAIRSLEEPISRYLPEYDGDILGETTLRHLVTRTTGLRFQKDGVVRRFAAGTSFEGKRPEILAAIVKRATGQTVAELLQERVFLPLGWTRTEWRTSGKETLVCDIHAPDSHPTLRLESDEGSDRNLYVSARELAQWGNLHLHLGFAQGRQLLPPSVFEAATSVQTPDSLPAHLPRLGFFWWRQDAEVDRSELAPELPAGTYQILGASGCSCTVIPAYRAVVVRMTNSLWTLGGANGFDYLADIRTFGRLAGEALTEAK